MRESSPLPSKRAAAPSPGAKPRHPQAARCSVAGVRQTRCDDGRGQRDDFVFRQQLVGADPDTVARAARAEPKPDDEGPHCAGVRCRPPAARTRPRVGHATSRPDSASIARCNLPTPFPGSPGTCGNSSTPGPHPPAYCTPRDPTAPLPARSRCPASFADPRGTTARRPNSWPDADRPRGKSSQTAMPLVGDADRVFRLKGLRLGERRAIKGSQAGLLLIEPMQTVAVLIVPRVHRLWNARASRSISVLVTPRAPELMISFESMTCRGFLPCAGLRVGIGGRTHQLIDHHALQHRVVRHHLLVEPLRFRPRTPTEK